MQAKSPETTKAWRMATRISFGYALIASIWIYTSDLLLVRLADCPPSLASLQTYKGWLFVAVTALLLYGLFGHLLAREYAAPSAAGAGDATLTQSTPFIPPLWQGARTPLLIFLALASGIGGMGYLIYVNQSQALLKATADELQTIADHKVSEISHWLDERRRGAEFIARDLISTRTLQHWLTTTQTPAEDETQLLQAWLTSLKETFAYSGVMLLDSSAQVRLGVGAFKIHPKRQALARQAMATGQVIMSDLHWRQEVVGGPIDLDLISSLGRTEDAQASGALVLKLDPGQYLFPLIQTWPTASPSAETLLVRREGEEVVYLNELRHRRNTALQLRLPLSSEALPAAQAARGESGLVEGVDYRQVPVLAALRAVPGTPWFLVAKVDAQEVYAPLRTLMWLVAVVGSLLIMAAGTGTVLWWRQQHAGFVAESYRRGLERQALVQRFDYLSKYANDIILLIDKQGRILEANDRAVTTYGYSQEELLRLNLRDLRASETHEELAEQMSQAARPEGLVFETVHCRKDGSCFPVEVSSRQIEIQGQPCLQSIIRDISERKQAEGKLASQKELLEIILQQAADGIVVCDAQGDLMLVNAAARQLALGEAAGRQQADPEFLWGKAYYPDGRAVPLQEWPLQKALRGDTTLGAEARMVRPDGSFYDVLISAAPLRNGHGIIGAVAMLSDITERRQMETALRESERRYRARSAELESLMDAIPAPVWIAYDPHCHHIKSNRAAAELLGMGVNENPSATPPNGLPLPGYQIRIDGQLVPARELPMQRATATGQPVRDLELEFVRRDGEIRWAYGGAVPLFDETGQVRGCIGTFLDITARKRAEQERERLLEEVRLTEQRLSWALQAGWGGAWDWDLESGAAWWSTEMYDLWGIPPGTPMHTENSLAIIDPCDRERIRSAIAQNIANHTDPQYEFRIHHPERGERWMATFARLIYDSAGRAVRMLGITLDITRYKHAEQSLRESEARLRAIVSAVPDVLLVLDEEGRYLEILSAQPQLLYTEPSAIKGRLASEVLPAVVAQAGLNAIRRTLLTRRPQSFEYELSIGRTGTHYYEARTAPLDAPLLGRPAVVLLARDVTAQRLTEESLRQAQKMEAVGQLTGGVAHDFNNLLAIILGNLEILAESIEQPQLLDLVQRALSATERGAALIQRLLAFARRQSLQTKPVDLNQLVIGMTELLARTLGETVKLKTLLAEDLAQTVIDPGQFETALINLAVNARDAMPQGGRLTIETANRWLDEDYARTQIFQVSSGPYVMLAVSDTGSGMPPEVVAHAFEPFFTTKEVGQGSGLGLSMVYGLVKQSGGHIQIYSELGRGTTVRIYLPARADTGSGPALEVNSGESPLPRGQGQTILVVEDEAPVRGLAVRMLQSLGYQTVEAETAATALEALEANPRITVLFTDVVLPGGKSGVDLAQEIHQRRPDLKILFTSGYTEAHLTRFSRHLQDNELLSKPYRKAQLAERLHALLHGELSDGD